MAAFFLVVLFPKTNSWQTALPLHPRSQLCLTESNVLLDTKLYHAKVTLQLQILSTCLLQVTAVFSFLGGSLLTPVFAA